MNTSLERLLNAHFSAPRRQPADQRESCAQLSASQDENSLGAPAENASSREALTMEAVAERVAKYLRSRESQDSNSSAASPAPPRPRHPRTSGSTPLLASGGNRAASLLLRRRFHEAWQKLVNEAREHALLQLEILIARLTERFGATSGWIFLREGEDKLCARATYHTRSAGLTLRTDGPGIVPHVARTGVGYLSNDVHRDPLYQNTNPDTRSELAVPIIDADGIDHGVVNLECRLKDAFTHEQIQDLTVAVGCLVPHLLVLENLESCPYHPDCHGWDLSRVLNRLCHAIAQALDEAEGSDTTDSTSCTVWYCDYSKRQLVVIATSGFDIEYISENSLPLDSFTGRVALGPRHKVWNCAPERALGFRRLDKIEITGLRRILATPIHVTENNWEGAACATLNIYSFAARRRESMPSMGTIRGLAREIGILIDGYRTQRLRIARAQMRDELQELPQPSATGCEAIKDLLKKMLDASGVSIWVPGVGTRESRHLYLAATTGIERRVTQGGMGMWHNPEPEPFYHLDNEVSFTTYLARHCGVPVRKVDVVDPSEPGLPDDFPRNPLNKYGERYALSELDRRRYLGIGVALKGKETLGVIRLNRASTAKPFTRCDEELLTALTELEEFKRALVDARKSRPESQTITASSVASVGESFRSPRLINAVASFLNPTPIPNVGLSKALVDQLVQSLMVLFRDYDVRRAGVLVDPVGKQRTGSRWYVCHDRMTRKPPTAEAWETSSDWQFAESARRVLTFDRTALSKGVRIAGDVPMMGVRLPVMVWTEKQLLRWTLALDFDRRVPWDNDTWNILFHAARKLSAILGRTDFVIQPNCIDVEPSEALAKLVALTQDDDAIRATGAELRFLKASGMKTVLRVGRPLPATSEQDWRSILGDAVGDEESACGVREWTAGRAWSVPLWLGPFVVGDLRCAFEAGPDLDARRTELFRTIPSLWSRLTCELQTPIWEPIGFTQGETRGGVTTWREQLVLRPLDFNETKDWTTAADLFTRL